MISTQAAGEKENGVVRVRRAAFVGLRQAAWPLARKFPLGVLLLAAGCARVPTVRAPSPDSGPAPAAAMRPSVAPAAVNANESGTMKASANAPVNPSNEMAIEVTSEPAGAIILVNDRPSGRAPLRVAVKTTPQGFCADYLTIKARFVASDASQVSQTTEADLTPREKAPKELVFTPQGVQRHLR